MDSQRVKWIVRTFLQDVRHWARHLKFDIDRLPRWIRTADVRIGYHQGNVFFVIDDGYGDDRIRLRDSVHSDVPILLDTPDFSPEGWWWDQNIPSNVFMESDAGMLEGKERVRRIVFEFSSDRPAFMPVVFAQSYQPSILFGTFFSHNPSREPNAPSKVRYVPLVLYFRDDGTDIRLARSDAAAMMFIKLGRIHDGQAGEFYRQWNQRDISPSHYHQTGVIVLGSYRNDGLPLLQAVRDHIKSIVIERDEQDPKRLYNSDLIIDIPDSIEDQSNEQKVRMWSLMARFVVMIDDQPSGAIAEYAYLKQDRVTLALLRPRSGGSTGMIGDEPLTDFNFIKVFEYDTTPSEVVHAAVTWAEDFVRGRAAAYNEAYAHRNS